MSPTYTFQTDWFSSTISNWAKSLSEFKSKPNLSFLEIGSFEGRSAVWLLENILTDDSSRLTCIDTWKGSIEHQGSKLDLGTIEAHFDHNIELAGKTHQIIKIKDYSSRALRKLSYDSYDFIYIDGSHKASDVLEDAVLCWRLLKVGGIMIFDDYIWEPQYAKIESPTIAIDSFLSCYDDQLVIIQKEEQVTVRKTK